MPLDDRLRDSLHGAADDVRPDIEHHLASVRQRSRRRSIPTSGLVTSVAILAAAVVLVRALSLDPLAMLTSVTEPGGQTTVTSPLESFGQDALVGTYEVRLQDPAVGTVASLAGDWRLTFRADSSIVLTPPETFDPPTSLPLEGYVYAVRDDRLFTNLFARHFQQGCSGSGTYRWALDGGQLTLEVMDDMCLQRIGLLTSLAWMRGNE